MAKKADETKAHDTKADDRTADAPPRQSTARGGPSGGQQQTLLPTALLSDRERIACLRLARTPSIGPIRFRELINVFGGATEALDALPYLLRRTGRHSSTRASIQICDEDQARAELDTAARIGAKPIFTIEPGYPVRLTELPNPPPVIYALGRIDLLSAPSVAIVGSRNASANGIAFARKLGRELGERGLTIVSGLARGVDGAAHRSSFATGTIAVVAGGIDVIYPPEHGELHAQIAAHGCLVAENPPGFEPRAKDFPRRNRIISGLSLGVVVVEAAARSGSLITARMALEQNRDVLAVPGHPLDPRAHGTNRLIRDGATLVTCADDVIEALSPGFAHVSSRTTGGQLGDAPPGRDLELWFDPENAQQPSVGRAGNADLPGHRPSNQPDDGPDDRPDDRADDRADGHPEPVPGDLNVILDALGAAPTEIDELARSTGIAIQSVRIILLELSLAGRVNYVGQHSVALTQGDIKN